MSEKKSKNYGLTNFAIKNRISVFVLIAMISILGLSAYFQLPKEDFPDIKFPYIFVSAIYPGASPQDIETLITKPAEKYLKSITDIKKVTSVSSESFASTFIEFNPGVSVDDALQKVRDKINLAKTEMPQDIEEPLIEEFSFERFPVMIISLSGNYSLVRLKDVAEKLQDKLDGVKGVLDTKIVGGLEREIQVDVDASKLNQFGLAIDDVMNTLKAENVNIPGGSIPLGDSKYLVRVSGEIKQVTQIPYLVVSTESGTPIYMRDIASATSGYKAQTSLSRYKKYNSVSVIVTRRTGENLIELSENVRKVLKENKTLVPKGIHLSIIGDRQEQIKSMVTELVNTIITGIILVVIVLMFFLGIQNALFVGIAITLSMLIGFVIFQLLGITMNMVVLFSLIYALGMLVDDGIVVVENVHRHFEEGEDAIEAAKAGTGDVALPVITSTLTTMGAFTPLLFWPGIMGGFMKYLPQTLIITLGASLFVALCVSPVLCSVFMKRPKKHTEAQDIYSRVEKTVILKAYLQILCSLIKDEPNKPSRLRRFTSNAIAIVAMIFGMVMMAKNAPVIDYALQLSPADRLVSILDHFGISIFFSTIGVGLLSFVFLSAIKEIQEKVIIRRFFMVFFLVLIGVSLPFLDSKTGYAWLIIGGILLAPLFYLAAGFGRYGSAYVKRSLLTHSFLILLFASFMALPGMDVLFFPNITPERVVLKIEMPAGTKIEKTDQVTTRVEEIVSKVAQAPTNIKYFVTNVGSSSGGSPYSSGKDSSDIAEISIDFYKKEERQEIARHYHINESKIDPFKTVEYLRKAIKGIPGGKISVMEEQKGPPSGKPISIEITGENFDQLKMIAGRVKSIVGRSFGVVNLTDTLSNGSPELTLNVDRQKAALLGVNTYQIASTVRNAIKGVKATSYRDDDDEIDVTVRLSQDQREDLNVLKTLVVTGKNSSRVMLSQIADISTASGLGSITRIDYKRIVNVEADVSKESNRTPRELRTEIEKNLAKANLNIPPDYSYRFRGQQDEEQASMTFLMRAFLVANFLIALILIYEFNSLIIPAIILFSVVLSFIGVVLGFFLAPILFRFSMPPAPFVIIMSGVGVVSLAGVVVKNAIVLLDYTQLLRERGIERTQAIIQSGLTRFRPVMLTAGTAILGLIPMSTGLSLDFTNRVFFIFPTLIVGASSSEWWAPLSDAVIFGLAVATILTLVMVPVFYYSLEGLSERLFRRRKPPE